MHGRVEFTKEMKRDYTILIPNMAPIHFKLIRNVFINHNYKMELLETEGRSIVDAGLKYVHNDTCYPALLVIGQFIDALDSGKYDLSKTALMITQTGGGCRASNYIHLLRKALAKAGYGYIPVISLSLNGMEKNSGFKFTLEMIRQTLAALAYGDLLMALDNQVKPYEVSAGDSAALVDVWIENLSGKLSRNKGYRLSEMAREMGEIAKSFARIKRKMLPKIKVGIVGEIYVKYSSLGNNGLEKFLFEQGCEVMIPGIIGFMMFIIDTRLEDIKLYGGSKIKAATIAFFLKYIEKIESALNSAIEKCESFIVPSPFSHIKRLADGVIGTGCKMGEGWLLTAEMLELAEQGYGNIVCTQPFGCLPNHIVGKGMINKIRERFPSANIVAIDYDPGATKVNQENRIKLMLAMAAEAMAADLPGNRSAAAEQDAVLAAAGK